MKKRRPDLTAEVRNQVVEAYKTGEKGAVIQLVHHISPGEMYRILKRAGVPVRKPGMAAIISAHHQKAKPKPRKLETLEPGVTRGQFMADLKKVSTARVKEANTQSLIESHLAGEVRKGYQKNEYDLFVERLHFNKDTVPEKLYLAPGIEVKWGTLRSSLQALVPLIEERPAPETLDLINKVMIAYLVWDMEAGCTHVMETLGLMKDPFRVEDVIRKTAELFVEIVLEAHPEEFVKVELGWKLRDKGEKKITDENGL